tara:strand:- start:825 stop:1175 length:351 start_codon:yes stop_codon:yes gene_type:complete
MVNLKSLIFGLLLFTAAHIVTWFQLNGQFFNSWFKNNNFILVLFGIPISYAFIFATKYIVEAFDGLLWPGRFVGFSVGIITFAFLTNQFMGEGINTKTLVSLILALLLVSVQMFWK